jgi:hypothetical protein
LNETERNGRVGKTVRKILAAADARFSLAPQAQADLLESKSDVEMVLLKLEGKL